MTSRDPLIQQAQTLAKQQQARVITPIEGRIAYVVSHGQSYASNGYAIRTQGIAQALNQHGLETLCFVRPGRPWELGVEKGSMTPEMVIDGVRYIHSRWDNDQRPQNELEHLTRSVEQFVTLFNIYRPAYVLAASNYIVGLPAWVAAQQLGIPFVNEVRGFWELSRDAREPGYANTDAFKQEAARDAFVAQQAERVFTLNVPMQQELERRGIDGKKITLVPNGVSQLPDIKPADSALKSKLGIKSDDKVIGYVGSHTAYEGLDTLVDACAELVKQGEKIKLLLVGDQQPLTQKSMSGKTVSGSPWIIQTGRVAHSDVANYYALINTVVIPRKKQTVCDIVPPMKAAEALAYGKRLVVSDVAPLAEYTRHKGVVSFKAENVKSLSSALLESLKLVAPKPTTELLFSGSVARMIQVLKEEKDNSLPKVLNNTNMSLVENNYSKTESLVEPENTKLHELNEEVKWESYDLNEGELLSISGEIVGEGVKGRKSIILVEAKNISGEELNLSSHGYLWSEAFNHWFKYLYPNQTKGNFFDFKNDLEKINVSVSMLKFGCSKRDKVFIKNKKVAIFSLENVGDSLQRFLNNKPSLVDVESLLYADITLNVIDGSSIWLSSMAKILASQQETILLLKEDVRNHQIFDDLKALDNLVIIQPSDFLGENSVKLDVVQSIKCLRIIDNYLPAIKNVVVRGLSAALELHETRQFKYRSFIYLTDFYSYDNNVLTITDEQKRSVQQVARQANHFFVQTSEIESKLKELSDFNINTTLLPPPLPKIDFKIPKKIEKGTISVVYAGKITPSWGVIELLDWSEILQNKGYKIKLTIIANKISAPGNEGRKFRALINARFKDLGVDYIPGLPREAVLEKLHSADFVWCYRPKELEESVLELSTKLVEAIACGARAINYPSKIHRNLLGEKYPFYVSSIYDFEKIICDENNFDMSSLAKKVFYKHSIEVASEKVKEVINSNAHLIDSNFVFAGHDRKFIDPYYSYLKSKGVRVKFDEWEWGRPGNEKRSKDFLEWSDKVFCEWGLANAVWYSNNNFEKKPLFIRLHLQEINPRAKKFGEKINQSNVTKFIVVSERVRQEAERMFGWASNDSIHIPNFVFDDEFTISNNRLRTDKEKIVLGMVGIVPQRKRFDRAIDLLLALRQDGYDAELVIKGPRPEEYDFMHSASRSPELEYYNNCYDKINSNTLLTGRVSFCPWGNDMPLWYEHVDYILSPSDFESFHYAVADGVLSGCYPIIWPWNEAVNIYSSSWCVSSIEEAKLKINEIEGLSKFEKIRRFESNRELNVSRYGYLTIYFEINNLLRVKGN